MSFSIISLSRHSFLLFLSLFLSRFFSLSSVYSTRHVSVIVTSVVQHHCFFPLSLINQHATSSYLCLPLSLSLSPHKILYHHHLCSVFRFLSFITQYVTSSSLSPAFSLSYNSICHIIISLQLSLSYNSICYIISLSSFLSLL